MSYAGFWYRLETLQCLKFSIKESQTTFPKTILSIQTHQLGHIYNNIITVAILLCQWVPTKINLGESPARRQIFQFIELKKIFEKFPEIPL